MSSDSDASQQDLGAEDTALTRSDLSLAPACTSSSSEPADQQEPLYVNPKQYKRILARRAARAELKARAQGASQGAPPAAPEEHAVAETGKYITF
eukprot:m51a1_g4001 hypothetical protein (95) ;mRNA; r:523078-523872